MLKKFDWFDKKLVILFHHYCVRSDDYSLSTIKTRAFSVVFYYIFYLLNLRTKKIMATNEQQYDQQLRVLLERFPQASADKLIRLLRRHGGDVDQV